MDREEFLKRANAVFTDCLALMDAKSHDYALDEDAFAVFRFSEMLGVSSTQNALMLEIVKKFRRLINLSHNRDEARIQEETRQDTIKDMINYLVHLYVWLEASSSPSSFSTP